MKSIIRGRNGAMSTKNMIIVILLAAILIGFVILVALYGFVDPEDRFDDPVVQGDKDVGSVLTYEIVDEGKTFEMEIIGQSGSYYFVDVSGLAVLAGAEHGWQMFHKETGLLRFGEEGEEVEIEVDGETVILVESFTTGEEGDIWMFASSAEDGIPYVIELTMDDVTLRAELITMEIIEPTEDYERPEALDEYFVYDVVITDAEGETTGTAYYYVVALCRSDYGLLELSVNIVTDEDGEEVEEITVGYELQSMSLRDFLFMAFTMGIPSTITEEISTVDGDKECNLHHIEMTFEGSHLEMTSYADDKMKVVYEVTYELDGERMEGTLIEYSIPA